MISEPAPIINSGEHHSELRKALDQSVSRTWCFASWLTATGLFILIVQILGGVIAGDSAESVYSTWSIAHLNLACAYSPESHFNFAPNATPYASVAPLYPILSSLVTAVLRIGHSVAFPSNAVMGIHCANANGAIYRWSLRSGALIPTLQIAYLGWIMLLASVIVLLRSTGRGRNGWEVVSVLSLAIVPPVWMSVATDFHPQDLVAMACILFAVASAVRGRWVLAGVFLGLAFTGQQFALLAIVPMLVLVPRVRRLSFLVAIALTIGVIDGPFILVTSGRALKTVIFGSSRLTIFEGGRFHAYGGTVLFATHLQGPALFIVARVLPVICAFAIALWVAKRLRSSALESETLLSLLATALCMRLVFEENLFGYYFMAVAVCLLCIDMLQHRLTGRVLVWIGMVMLAFNPIPWWLYLRWEVRGLNLFMALPLLFEVIVVGSFLIGARRRNFRWYLVASSIIVGLTCFPPLWGRAWTPQYAPGWLWQIILVPTGLVLTSETLRSVIRNRKGTHLAEIADAVS